MNGLGRRIARRALLGCGVGLIVAVSAAAPDPAVAQGARKGGAAPYPVVITKAQALRTFGLLIKGITTDTAQTALLPIRCYSYGEGGYDLSISNDFLARFKARGFSRRSLCMALVSEARFDPESGQRLPTYILANPEKLKLARSRGQKAEPGDVTSELPFDVPDCFKNGVPYSDCEMNYDLITGRRLTAQQTQAFKRVGARIERKLRDPAVRNAFAYVDQCEFAVAKSGDDCELTAGMITVGFQGPLEVGAPSTATVYDYSNEFPNGFGYALNADGSAAPDPSADSVQIAMDGNRRATEASLTALRERLKSR